MSTILWTDIDGRVYAYVVDDNGRVRAAGRGRTERSAEKDLFKQLRKIEDVLEKIA